MGDDLAVQPRVGRAIEAAQRAGVVATIATGRMLEVARPYARELRMTAPLICYQGGLLQAPSAPSPLFVASMDAALVREALAWASTRQWHPVLYTQSVGYVARGTHPPLFHAILSRERIVWVDSLLAILENEQPVKLVFIDDPQKADSVEAVMRRRFKGRMAVVRSHRSVVEGSPLGVTKGDGLRMLAEHLGTPQAATMAIGDQDNDVSMIVWAGLGVAMGDGSPAARAAADWVAPPLAEDGAAVAITRFVLGASPTGELRAAAPTATLPEPWSLRR
jgi:Cof subfamily protein (haloacid dehalogenase superfamily)